MPGRLAIYDDTFFKENTKHLIKNDLVKLLTPNFNIAPTLPIPALLNNGNYLYTHFGYMPSWAKDRSSMNINARSESIYEKKTFRESFIKRRCIIPINGFYEWKVDEKNKIPYFVQDIKNDFLALAGIWDEWFDINLNMKIVTIALITCDANEKLNKIHHRMPIVLEKQNFEKWLGNTDLRELVNLFKPYSSENIKMYQVTDEVNKVLFNNSSCIEEIKKEKIIKDTLF